MTQCHSRRYLLVFVEIMKTFFLVFWGGGGGGRLGSRVGELVFILILNSRGENVVCLFLLTFECVRRAWSGFRVEQVVVPRALTKPYCLIPVYSKYLVYRTSMSWAVNIYASK